MSHQDSRITVAHRLLAPASWTVGQRQAALIASMIACLAYFYLVPAPLLALPGLLIFAVLAWGRLDLALALLPLTFPFWYVPKRLFNDKVFPLSEIVLAVCVALALAHLVQVLWRRHWRLPARAWALSHIRVLVRRVGPLTIASAVLFVLGVSLGCWWRGGDRRRCVPGAGKWRSRCSISCCCSSMGAASVRWRCSSGRSWDRRCWWRCWR